MRLPSSACRTGQGMEIDLNVWDGFQVICPICFRFALIVPVELAFDLYAFASKVLKWQIPYWGYGQALFHWHCTRSKMGSNIKVNTEPCCVLCVLNLKLRWLSVHPELLCSTATTPPWGPFDPWPTHHPACHPALPCLWNWISDCSEILQLQLHSRPSAEDGIWENWCHLKPHRHAAAITSACNMVTGSFSHIIVVFWPKLQRPQFSVIKWEIFTTLPNAILTKIGAIYNHINMQQ